MACDHIHTSMKQSSTHINYHKRKTRSAAGVPHDQVYLSIESQRIEHDITSAIIATEARRRMVKASWAWRRHGADTGDARTWYRTENSHTPCRCFWEWIRVWSRAELSICGVCITCVTRRSTNYIQFRKDVLAICPACTKFHLHVVHWLMGKQTTVRSCPSWGLCWNKRRRNV